MNITIRGLNNLNNKIRDIRLPMEEEWLYEICNDLGIEITTEPNCYIEDSMDKDFLRILNNNNCNIDELNYLAKRLDSFSRNEKERFYAAVHAENLKTMTELINLTFNVHCYSLITDFSDFNKVGKDLYLTEKQAVATRELDELDGESYALDVIKNNSNFTVTPYGVLYKNSNAPEQVYNGKQFPPYQWKETIATVQLTFKGENEYIYLPCSDIDINKALMRLDTPYLQDCEVAIDSHNFPDRILNIVPDDTTQVVKVDTFNNLARCYKEMGSRDIWWFEKLMDHVRPRTVDEVIALADSMYEFEIFDGIKDIESYGRYMICESGRFEYDPNLEEYIDFKRYGQEKMAQEVGAFSERGYVTYHGHNKKLSDLLFESLGIVFPEQKELQTLKLYMPLEITTYDIENEYGYRELSLEAQEVSNHEVVEYMDEILMAIEGTNYPEEEQRGLMTYYDGHDSINAKVLKYVFTVELVEDELMGVAVLTLNDELTPKELEKIKGEITGQASDGWGENFEQREINTDMGGIYISFWNSNSHNWFIKTAEEMRCRQKMCEYAKKHGVTKAARKYHTNRQFIYRQLDKYDGDVRSLALKSRKPHSHPNAHIQEELDLIKRMLKRNGRYGLAEVYVRCLKKGYKRSYGSMCRQIRKRGYQKPKIKRKSYTKYTQLDGSYPGEKVQIDIKYVPKECIRFPTYGKSYYQITAIDEYSRKRVLKIVEEKSTYETAKFLETLEEKIGFKIKMIQVDNGYEFVNDKDKTAKKTAFEKVAIRKGYEIKRTRPYSPWQNGKVERSHREDGKILYSKQIFTSKKELITKVRKHEKRYNSTAKKVLNFKSPNEVVKESKTIAC